jgi:uncharacterized spore protein YtfJ
VNKAFDQLTATSVENQEQSIALLEKLVAVATPGSVFGEPTRTEGRTIITASEVNVALGVGFGFGGGTTPARAEERKRHRARSSDPHERVDLEEAPQETDPEGEDAGMGGGGGGGGGASGRPVAVISVTEDGVRVEPVVDATKIALAFFTALGSMLFMLLKMRKAAEDAG